MRSDSASSSPSLESSLISWIGNVYELKRGGQFALDHCGGKHSQRTSSGEYGVSKEEPATI